MPKARIIDLAPPAPLATTGPESCRIREHSSFHRQFCSIRERSDSSHILSLLLRKGPLRNWSATLATAFDVSCRERADPSRVRLRRYTKHQARIVYFALSTGPRSEC